MVTSNADKPCTQQECSGACGSFDFASPPEKGTSPVNPSKRGRGTRLALAALGAVGALAILAGVAGAVNGTVTLSAGSLTITPPTSGSIDFGSHGLTGLDTWLADTTQADTRWTVLDATGDANGWSITASETNASGFKCGACSGTPSLGFMSVNGSSSDHTSTTGPTYTCDASSTCSSSTAHAGSASTYPLALTTSLQTIASQVQGYGLGKATVDVVWWLGVPGDAAAGSYTDTITLSTGSGPSS